MKLKILSTILCFWTSQAQALSDSETIRQARVDQNYLLAAGDFDRASAFWTEDVTVRRGLGISVTGKEAYRSLFSAVQNEKSVIFVREPDLIEVSPHWPLAFESGFWTARRGSSDGPVAIGGRYSAQWVKRDGYWLIRSELYVALSCNEESSIWPALP